MEKNIQESILEQLCSLRLGGLQNTRLNVVLCCVVLYRVVECSSHALFISQSVQTQTSLEKHSKFIGEQDSQC